MAAIVASDINFHKTVNTSPGNSTANTTNGTYVGGYASSTLWAGGVANDLFADITGAQNAANYTDYAGLYIENANVNNDWVSPAAYISAETNGGAALALGVDTTAQSPYNQSGTPQMLVIANSTTAPAGVTFTSPTTFGAGVALGTLTKNRNGRGLWVRRQITGGPVAAVSNDGGTITIQGDTGNL